VVCAAVYGCYTDTVQPTIDQLADGLMRLGYEDDDMYPPAEVEPEVWEELKKRGHVSLKTSGAPKLTAKGQKTFTAMEAGDDIPNSTTRPKSSRLTSQSTPGPARRSFPARWLGTSCR
jgi:hypothetical protein